MRGFVLSTAATLSMAFTGPASATPRRRVPPATTAPTAVCIAGAQVSCACPGGGTGVQRCNPDGSGLGECRCLPSPSSYSAPPTVTPATLPLVAPTARPRNPPTVVRWYGWQTLLFDIGASALGFVAVGTDSVGVAIASGAVSLLGPPIVHMAHGNYSNAGVSFGLRGGNVAWLAYYARKASAEDFSTAVIAASVIQIGIIVMDAAWLGRDRVAAPPPSGVRLTGSNVLVLNGGAGLSLSGAF